MRLACMEYMCMKELQDQTKNSGYTIISLRLQVSPED